MESYKIRFVDRVLDPVHGFIDLTQVEKEIVELPIFKRLQSIKQLSLTNWIFPGAEHTRYMHSLGVMHIADQMALHLSDAGAGYSDSRRQLIRLAGLLHDIGHYPLSHVTEYVYNSDTNGDLSLLSHNSRIKGSIDSLTLSADRCPVYMKDHYARPLHHEAIGARLIACDEDIRNIIARHCPFIDPADIQDIIVGCAHRNPDISAMVQLLHSELDADGIDYIMRDASFSGTSYGGFELGLLLRNLVVSTYHGAAVVGIRPKGIAIADQYLTNKYFAYTQVFFNRHVAIIEAMASIFSKALVQLDASVYPSANTLLRYVDNHRSNDSFLKFTDRAFWAQLDQIHRSDLECFFPAYIADLHEKLLHYQEFPMESGSEIILSSDDPSHAAQTLRQTELYRTLSRSDTNTLALFHRRAFTSQRTEEDFRAALCRHGLAEEFIPRNTARLQEGIAVIDENSAPHLLVDDPRSIMSRLANTCTYILRGYSVC